ncbi:MAG: DUF167 domain-containing protein [Puniceicoccales bacterium]|jgi:uncharacterized protein (TIGR00251 family)|nr:DUF167 domain-containing protein [Puniceicoccales bacterium]
MISVKVTPHGSHCEVQAEPGKEGKEYRIKLTASAQEGKANAQLVAVLAEHFGVPKNNVHIRSGWRARHKKVDIEGVGEE